MGFGLEDLQAFLTNEAPAAMEEEQAKGPDSDTPEQTMAMISALKDHLTGGGPVTRASTSAAAGQDLNSITARKAALNEQLATTGKMTSSQTVGLAVLALGLMGAAAAVKGKRGLAMGANAFGTGGKIFLDSERANTTAANKSTIAQMNALNAQEKDLTKFVQDNAMAPIKREEAVQASVDSAVRRKAAGAGDGVTVNNIAPNNISQTESRQAAQAMGTVQEALEIAKELRKLPSDTWQDTASWQAKAATTATKEGKLYARAFDFAKAKVKVLNPGNPSEWEGKTGLKTTIGDIITGPGDIAQLLEQSAGVLANTAASNLETATQLRKDPSALIQQYRNIAKSVGVNHVQPGILGDPAEEVDEESLIPEELRPDTPKKTAAPAVRKTIGQKAAPQEKEITQNGKRGKLVDGIFYPYKGQ